jgi:hypothetical protein
MRFHPEQLGDPDLKVGPFCLWILGREFDQAQDFWDGNWLLVIAVYQGLTSKVVADGPLVHLRELDSWLKELIVLQETNSGTAKLDCIEPGLSVTIGLTDGKGTLETFITPNHLTDSHSFEYEIDQSYPRSLISSLHRVSRHYEMRGAGQGR